MRFYLAGTGATRRRSLLNWELKYIKAHPTIAPAGEFHITDADYADFKKDVLASKFKYDGETEKYLQQLVKLAKFEGYYDDAKPEFDAIEKKLKHNVAKDLDYNSEGHPPAYRGRPRDRLLLSAGCYREQSRQ